MHKLCHGRRSDNLATVIHTAVEVVFLVSSPGVATQDAGQPRSRCGR
jgi:hypothetical protein